ncbi:carbohydrate ABC transporter membrane protein 1, CUT1 family [Psychromonas ingrahamii 37]|uniref:Carbohydrate ABC transporter membrane protein 1, CUT1 family n=2 Tax=Psychromonas ingrahamii TaxID=357794 RepID=A1SXL5_PSYIN|nr:carbohydrate ABC transporter membrane protein 1, CUT1 family [Psychromonas ingrahamii 37]
MVIFGLFLLYPFAKGIWISLHEWNLLEVAFNPDAKEFVGLDNYIKLLFPRSWDFEWDQLLLFRVFLGAGLTFLVWNANKKNKMTPLLWGLSIAALLIIVYLMGWGPENGGRIGDRRFWTSVGNTVKFVLYVGPLITVLALVLAIQLNKPGKTTAILRTIFFSTQVLSVTVVTLVWQLMYSPQNGFIANIFEIFGMDSIAWLTNQNLAMPAIVIATVWWSLGFALVVFLSGLQSIPNDRLEAARLDGAKGWGIIWYVIVPSIKGTITFVLIMQLVLHFQVFGQSHLMTNGGPGDSTQVLVRYIYQTAFRDSNVGYASAMAIMLFIIMMTFSLIQAKVSKRGEQ